MTKVLRIATKNEAGGGRVGDNNILTFYATGSTKNVTLKNCILGNFPIRICKDPRLSLHVRPTSCLLQIAPCELALKCCEKKSVTGPTKRVSKRT